MIDYELDSGDGATEKHTIKCTRNAAASIAMTCAESPYTQAVQLLDRLAGLDLSVMTEFRVTDSVGSEFVRDVPVDIDSDGIAELAENMSGNALETRVQEMSQSDCIDETIDSALKDGPEGVLYKDYAGPTIKVMYIEGDGTGVPGWLRELAGVKGKQPDGSAKTFEAKIGAVFTVEYTFDGKPLLKENGEIYRDKNVSYMGTVRKAGDFGPMLYRHAVENGLEDVDAVVFLGDGARWLWGIQETYFPNALTGIDLYHAIERANALVDLLKWKNGTAAKQDLKDECIDLLRCGKVQDMLDLIKSRPIKKGNDQKLDSAMGYFRSNMERMNYGVFAACGMRSSVRIYAYPRF